MLPVAPIRVLVVEDFEQWRSLICSLLGEREEFHLVGEVADGLEAVRKAKELQPQLILLNICLPDLNGIEAARCIRHVAPGSKILFISMDNGADVVEAALASGANGYLAKSDVGSEFWTAIEAVLQGKKFVSSSIARSLSVAA